MLEKPPRAGRAGWLGPLEHHAQVGLEARGFRHFRPLACATIYRAMGAGACSGGRQAPIAVSPGASGPPNARANARNSGSAIFSSDPASHASTGRLSLPATFDSARGVGAL